MSLWITYINVIRSQLLFKLKIGTLRVEWKVCRHVGVSVQSTTCDKGYGVIKLHTNWMQNYLNVMILSNARGFPLQRSFESSIVNNEILTSYSTKLYHSCSKQAFWSNSVILKLYFIPFLHPSCRIWTKGSRLDMQIERCFGKHLTSLACTCFLAKTTSVGGKPLWKESALVSTLRIL